MQIKLELTATLLEFSEFLKNPLSFFTIIMFEISFFFFKVEAQDGMKFLMISEVEKFEGMQEHKGPFIYYVSKRTGWVGSTNGRFCRRSVLYHADIGWVGQKRSKNVLT